MTYLSTIDKLTKIFETNISEHKIANRPTTVITNTENNYLGTYLLPVVRFKILKYILRTISMTSKLFIRKYNHLILYIFRLYKCLVYYETIV